MTLKLTDRIISELPLPATGNRIEYDTEVKGFGIRLTAGGSRSFVLNYRIGRRERRHTIGASPTWKVKTAREEAASLKRDIDRGIDPLAERDKARTAPTVAHLCDRYMAEHARTKKKPSSAAEDGRNINLHVRPALGKLLVTDVERDDVARLHHHMSGSPTGANRVLSLISKMFALAELWGLRPANSNPARGIDRYEEKSRERLITAAELARLGDALAAHRGYWAGPAAIRLLVLTGMRKSEVLALKWDDIDPEGGAARLPDSKTGAKMIPIGAAALAVLSGLPKVEGNPFVLPAARPRRATADPARPQHFIQLQTAWENITSAAGIEALRIHDLRHAFASVGASGGDSLFIIGKVLGHADSKTTQRYAHLKNDPLRAVADRISGEIAASLAGKTAEIVPRRRS
jgi:integrase